MIASSAGAPDDAFTCSLPRKPYPGLRPFESSEWPVFFGRERMTDDVIARLQRDRLLVVHGDSGCGKSSLISAGVLPNLEQSAARGGARWRTCSAVPGDRPLWNLATALAGLDGRAADHERVVEMRRILNFGGEGAAALVNLLGLDAGDQVCVLVDQFEEVFAHAKNYGPHEANLLVDLLIGIQQLQQHSGLCAVLTMRSEFLGACAKFARFAEVVNAMQYLLPRMEHADLVRAIREPATLYDGDIDLNLAERLIADAGGGQDQLPLIQHGLMLLYRQHVVRAGLEGKPWTLTVDAYVGGQGLADLLSGHADEVMRSVGHERTVEAIFRSLTAINSDGHAMRRPQRFDRLCAVTGDDESTIRAVLDAFRAEGVSFVRPYINQPLAPDTRIDISHEALIRCWKRIADEKNGWLSHEFKEGLVWQSLLVQAESFEQDPSNVLSPATTEERAAWLPHHSPAWAERYGGGSERVRKLMAASIAERDRQKKEEDEERLREQRARMNEEKLREKAHTLRLFRAGFVVVLVLVVVATWQAVAARRATNDALRARDEAQRATEEAQDAAASNDAARQRAEAKRAELEQSVVTLREALGNLQKATATAQLDTSARSNIYLAQATIEKQVAQIATVANPPRVYMHISEEAQRETLRQLSLDLEKEKLGGDGIVVPGIQRVKPIRGNELRCFRASECEDARRVVDILNRLVASPKVVLNPMTGTSYEDSPNIRPRHFELWFAPGPITLRSAPSDAGDKAKVYRD
ncbi:MAG TPA: hypothetical protein VGF24_07085 [Vicinamibacterales bacterium]|jgi:hypothetical protein